MGEIRWGTGWRWATDLPYRRGGDGGEGGGGGTRVAFPVEGMGGGKEGRPDPLGSPAKKGKSKTGGGKSEIDPVIGTESDRFRKNGPEKGWGKPLPGANFHQKGEYPGVKVISSRAGPAERPF